MRLVRHVEHIFIRKLLADGFEHRKPADARIKDAERSSPSITRHAAPPPPG